MLWKWTHNGFHGRTELTIRVPDGSEAGDRIELSDAVARRLNNAVCGSGECSCAEHAADYEYEHRADPGRIWFVILPERNGEQRGHYPQAA